MIQTLQIQQQVLSISEVLRTYGKQFKQIKRRFSDEHNGRCAMGVILSYYGWDGADKIDAGKKLSTALNALNYTGIDKNLLIKMNDSGFMFDQIADYINIACNSKYC